MNQVATTKLIKGIRDLCERDEAADRLFTSFQQRKNDAREMTVRRAAELAASDYPTMLQIFRALDALGAGRFIPGRHGHESRLAWGYSIRSLGQIASGRSSIAQQVPANAPVEDVERGNSSSPIRHEFALRQDFRVRFELPSDLTEKEAERLSTFVKSLPL